MPLTSIIHKIVIKVLDHYNGVPIQLHQTKQTSVSDTAYWNTAMAGYWDTAMTALWDTAMTEEV